ncbi:TetR/AcrR family transcriptional regulator [Tropicimonas sp. S265A]|uniref:TetR/AcrR family transcriptional regulator n=1 Tax=Tropicimonas sp. S265A TaxID=3415134 RepID=UPI003C7C6763
MDTVTTAPAYRRRKDQRPQEILDAGLEEFHAHGYARASLSRIAKRAGVSRATLYLYFDGKDALFLAIADHAMISFTQDAAQQVQSSDASTEDTLRALFGQFYSVMTTSKNNALMRILIAEGPEMPALVNKYHAQVLSRGRALLERIIARGIERGEVRESAATAIPQLLIAPVMFYCIHDMVFSEIDPLDVQTFMEGHLEMVLRGISI